MKISRNRIQLARYETLARIQSASLKRASALNVFPTIKFEEKH